MTTDAMPKRKRKTWARREVEVLHREYASTSTADLAARFGRSITSVYAKAALLGLKKTEAYLNGPDAGRLKPGHSAAASTRFQPAHRPPNKGVKGWQAGGDSEKTRFKTGHRGGKAAELYQPIGTERVTKDGYLQRKVNDDMPLQRRWKMVHNLVWEEHRGPIPRGHIVTFRNGKKDDIRIDNLELLSRAENMRRNSVHRFPKPLADLCQLKGALQRQINKRMKSEKQN